MQSDLQCSKCSRAQSTEAFRSASGKLYKVCNRCRAQRVQKYQNSKEDVLQETPRTIRLVEKVDRQKLHYVITNSSDFDIGKSYVRGQYIDGNAQLKLLCDYYNRLNTSGETRVTYNQIDGFGRMFGDGRLQIQGMARRVRHTICKERLTDIDIKNAHPQLLLWYCGENNIDCEGLRYYIDNRDECVAGLMERFGLCRDEIKADLLAVINGRMKTEEQLAEFPEWYVEYYHNLKDIGERVIALEPELYARAERKKRVAGKEGYNLNGTTINYVMCDLEHRALMCAYDVCNKHQIRVASLVFDGLMVYKSDVSPSLLKQVLIDMAKMVKKRLPGCELVFVEKEMDEGFDLESRADFGHWEESESLNPKLFGSPSEFLFKIDESDYVHREVVAEDVGFVQDLDWGPRTCLAINAPMGRGKTSAVCRWISENQPQRVLVLSPRVSYAKSICHEYNEKIVEGGRFKCYKDISDFSTDRLVCSMESLYKINFEFLTKHPFDLVVLDECQANLSSHVCVATNKKNFNDNSRAFWHILRASPKILMMDAFLNPKVLSFLTDFELPTRLIEYTGLKMSPRRAVVIDDPESDYDTLLAYILRDLQQGKRCYCVVSSAKRLCQWTEKLKRSFPQKTILSYASGEGKKIENVREEWGLADCVLTTSTITVGINFDTVDHFDRAYLSFSARSKNKVVDLIQTHYRVRHLRDNLIFVHIVDNPIGLYPTDGSDILEMLKWFEREMISTYDLLEAAPDYLKRLLCHCQLEQNISIMNLTRTVYDFLDRCNYSVSIEKKLSEEEEDLDSEDDEEEQEEVEDRFEDISLIDRETFIELSKLRAMGRDLSEKHMAQLIKFKFISFFTDDEPSAWVSDWYDHDFWLLFNSFYKGKMSHIKTEKLLKTGVKSMDKLFSEVRDNNTYAVMSKRKHLQNREMVQICNDLGLDCSQEVGKVIPANRVREWFGGIRERHDNIRKVFDLRDQRKDKSAMLTDKDCLELLNSVFKTYGFTKISLQRKRIRVNGKQVADPNSAYEILSCEPKIKNLSDKGSLGARIYDAVTIEKKVGRPINTDYSAEVAISDCRSGCPF